MITVSFTSGYEEFRTTRNENGLVTEMFSADVNNGELGQVGYFGTVIHQNSEDWCEFIIRQFKDFDEVHVSKGNKTVRVETNLSDTLCTTYEKVGRNDESGLPLGHKWVNRTNKNFQVYRDALRYALRQIVTEY